MEYGDALHTAQSLLYRKADMAMAFEYYLDTDYEFNTDFSEKAGRMPV